MQSQYSRLVQNLSKNNATYRDTLIKSVSATKTHLEAINNKVLNDDVEAAVRQFEVMLTALNDLLEDFTIKSSASFAHYNMVLDGIEPEDLDPKNLEAMKKEVDEQRLQLGLEPMYADEVIGIDRAGAGGDMTAYVATTVDGAVKEVRCEVPVAKGKVKSRVSSAKMPSEANPNWMTELSVVEAVPPLLVKDTSPSPVQDDTGVEFVVLGDS